MPHPTASTSRTRLRNGGVLVGSLLLHAAILAGLAWPVVVRFQDRSNDEGAIDVSLERPRRAARPAQASGAAALVARPSQAPVPAGVETIAAPPVAASAPGQAIGQATGRAPMARADLGAALRAGGFGCASERRAGLSAEELSRCEEKLGALALKSPSLPAPIDPAKRAYYDAVAAAYGDHAPMVPLTPPSAKGMFDPPDSYNNGHGPRVGCSVKFGPNASKAPKGPANALRAGPCFIQPPVGSLTPEGDIQKPY